MQTSLGFSQNTIDGLLRLGLSGDWSVASGAALEAQALDLLRAGRGSMRVELDLGAISNMDTAGAWLIDRTKVQLAALKCDVTYLNTSEAQAILLREAHYREFEVPKRDKRFLIIGLLADVGSSMVFALRDLTNGVAFLGELVQGLVHLMRHPRQFRLTSMIFQIERIAFRSVPIVGLINFLVGCIVAQQGIFQLQRFGAAPFAVDLIGILVLRELAVLLTSIMIAGRSGSAITAELGSMKMREEIDALRVMGLNPVHVLLVPRVLALIISLPILCFIGDMMALFGGLLTAWVYGDITPQVYLDRLQEAIGLNTFLVGLIKAPFMALVIGLNACVEGLAVGGSAESLGKQVTSSVVKSIFMVIVVDGVFAIYFAGIHY
jgi:phospholipid/cholesterol/gamma-HCH transport system permease protein